MKIMEERGERRKRGRGEEAKEKRGKRGKRKKEKEGGKGKEGGRKERGEKSWNKGSKKWEWEFHSLRQAWRSFSMREFIPVSNLNLLWSNLRVLNFQIPWKGKIPELQGFIRGQ